jgi:transposase
MAPEPIRDLRRVLRFRNLMVRQAVRMKNKTAGLLMECGVEYEKRRLHGRAYYADLLESLEDIPPSLPLLLNMSRATMETFDTAQKRLVHALKTDPRLSRRVELLTSIPGVGEVTALTWALEIGPVDRFPTIAHAISYCGLCSDHRESAGKTQRTPLSKQRNRFLQTALIEAAKLAPQWNPQLAALRARVLESGHHNQASIAIARKLVAYLMAVDRSGIPFTFRSVRSKAREDSMLSTAQCA